MASTTPWSCCGKRQTPKQGLHCLLRYGMARGLLPPHASVCLVVWLNSCIVMPAADPPLVLAVLVAATTTAGPKDEPLQ